MAQRLDKEKRKELRDEYKQKQQEMEQARALRDQQFQERQESPDGGGVNQQKVTQPKKSTHPNQRALEGRRSSDPDPQGRHRDINQRQTMDPHRRPMHTGQNRLDSIRQNEPDSTQRRQNWQNIKDFGQQGQDIQSLKNQLSSGEQDGARRKLLQEKLNKRQKGRARSMIGAAKSYAATGSKIGTARILQVAWLNLIDTFGLTLIYINFHFLMAHILKSEMFCKFGEEWTPKSGRMVAAGGGKGKGMFGAGSKVLELGEILLMLVLDALIVVILFGLFIILLLIIDSVTKWQLFSMAFNADPILGPIIHIINN
ncbi:hypothetical protein KKA15_07145 [Patescibacteria group bacterium]|nr:hypothetical protein [Patescibacteria group bacterium]